MQKKILTIVLLAFVVISLGVMAVREFGSNEQQPQPDASEPAMTPQAKMHAALEEMAEEKILPQRIIRVMYFHGDKRCKTCNSIEQIAADTLKAEFPEELATEELQWQAINVDLPENEHYIDDYELSTKTIIVSETLEGKEINWVNLDQVWDKIHDPEEYIAYIKQNVSLMLDKKDEKKEDG